MEQHSVLRRGTTVVDFSKPISRQFIVITKTQPKNQINSINLPCSTELLVRDGSFVRPIITLNGC